MRMNIIKMNYSIEYFFARTIRIQQDSLNKEVFYVCSNYR